MQERTKKKIIAAELVILILLSTVVVYTNLDKLENIIESIIYAEGRTKLYIG